MLGRLGIKAITAEDCVRLVGRGTDGAAVNIASNAGLKGLITKEVPRLFLMWCFAHRLELAIKDSLKGAPFSLLDEILLRLYPNYEKSPKNCLRKL